MDWIETTSLKVNAYLMKNQETGEVNYLMILIAFGIPILLIIGIMVIVHKNEAAKDSLMGEDY